MGTYAYAASSGAPITVTADGPSGQQPVVLDSGQKFGGGTSSVPGDSQFVVPVAGAYRIRYHALTGFPKHWSFDVKVTGATEPLLSTLAGYDEYRFDAEAVLSLAGGDVIELYVGLEPGATVPETFTPQPGNGITLSIEKVTP